MITVNAMGDSCPIPVVKTLNAIRELKNPDVVETLVDNEIAVQNLTRMANQKGHAVKSEKLAEKEFKVTITVGSVSAAQTAEEEEAVYRRGRNAKSPTMAKNATMADYRKATGFEALVGYLYIQDKFERIVELVKAGVNGLGLKL